MSKMTCKLCKASFDAVRNTAKYCSPACRKQAHQLKERKKNPVNRTNSAAQRRDEDELYELNFRMSETYFGLPPARRPHNMTSIIQLARDGNPKIKRLLTNWKLLRPGADDTHCHWRGTRQYPTIAQEAHEFAIQHWGVGIKEVINCPNLEPLPDKERRQIQSSDDLMKNRIAVCWKKIPLLRIRPRIIIQLYAGALISGVSLALRSRRLTSMGMNELQYFPGAQVTG